MTLNIFAAADAGQSWFHDQTRQQIIAVLEKTAEVLTQPAEVR